MDFFKGKSILRKVKNIFSRNIKLQTDILFETIAILSASIILIIGYTYYSNTQAILEQAEKHIVRSTTDLKDDIFNTLRDAENIVNIYVPIFNNVDLNNMNKRVSLINSITSVLGVKTYLTAAYFGTPEGYFWQVVFPKTLESYMLSVGLKVPEQTTSIVKVIDNTDVEIENIESSAKLRNDFWYYVKNNKTVSKPIMGQKTEYDHRKRDWFKDASKSQELHWTNIYVFATVFKGEPGITVSRSIYNAQGMFKGVFSLDMTLKGFSQFLSRLKISDNAKSYVIDDKDKMVANSALKPVAVIKEQDYSLISVKDFGDPVLAKALETYKKEKGKESVIYFEYEKMDYIASIQDFPKVFQNNWKAVVVVPSSDFVHQIKENRNSVLNYSILILVCAFILSYLLARRISKPIKMLSAEAKRIKNLDFSNNTQVESKISEIIDLNAAIMSLKSTVQSFSCYIPKNLVKNLMSRKQSIQIGGKAKEVTLMFTDIIGFTSISEEITADKLIIYLSDYFEEMTQIIMKNEGTVDKYIGDAIMSFWGAPIPDRHHAFNACRSALLCQKRLEEINRIWKREGRPVFMTRMGVHLGEVIVGNIGSTERMNYTAIGDSVNLCSRLEAINKEYGTKIIISEAVYQVVKDRFLCRTLDYVAVKGKKNAIKIHELVGQIKGDNALYPTDEQVEFCKLFEQAHKLYMSRQWKEALELFEFVKGHASKGDLSVKIYIERCLQYIDNPPPKDWDGTHVMTSK